MIDPKYLIYHDLIGIQAYIKLLSNKTSEKFTYIGIVIDETKNMIITEKEDKIKQYIKKDYLFRFILPNNKNNEDDYCIEVHGAKIIGLPVNRLRSLKKRRWYKR
jgi:RNase P/RNase MRP subunit p29